MDGHRRGSSSLPVNIRSKNLHMLDEGDRLIGEINQHLVPYKSSSEDHPTVDMLNLREATIELGRLIAWASELIAAQSLVSYRSTIRQDMVAIQHKHSLFESAPARDAKLDDSVKAFVERVGALNDALEVISWD